MPRYRLDLIASLARQLGFAPLDVREAQLALAERLLNDLDLAKSYPPEYVVFRVTGYQPRAGPVGEELLTGLALQHDLGLLIDEVSGAMGVRAADVAEPVLSIDDVTARFNVTSKTIQRWRRKGLVSRRFVFADGKNRVGFLLSSIERFIARHAEVVRDASNLTSVDEAERLAMARHARRLFARCGCTEAEATRRLARRFRRSALTVLHTLRKHDQLRPGQAVLPLATAELSASTRAKCVRAVRRGWSLARVARRVARRRSSVHRLVMDDRVATMLRRRVSFHDDELYHGDSAAETVESIVRAGDRATVAIPSRREDSRVPSRLPPYIADLYRTPLLAPPQERALFLAFNFRKYEFATARRRFDPEVARKRDLDALERLARRVADAKNRIVAANLRLVVSVARRHVSTGGPTLMELISEGNVILMRAVEGFDLHRNVRFSTYATLALMKGFARLVPELRGRQRRAGSCIDGLDLADRRLAPTSERLADREQVARLLAFLSPTERRVIATRFGLEVSPDRASPRAVVDRVTYANLGRALGMTKHRVRQLERTALEKLRGAVVS